MKELKVISLYFFLIVNLFSGLHLEAKSIVSGDIVEGQAYQPNFLKQKGHFEKNANGTSAYADAAGTRPVDGSGGSPTLTCTRTTSSPIDGDGSLLITKDAANRQGQGCTIQFTIDSAYKAKVLQIEFDYLVASGTFTAGSSSADSDLIVYIYDVTNSTLIEPSSIKLLSNSSTISDHFVANFQTSATGTTYNLILHQATTSASAYTVKADNFEVKPSKYIYGTPISDWVSFTPTGSWSSNTTYTGLWRRVGSNAEIKYNVATSGAPTASQLTLNLPSGLTIDTTKMLSTSNTTAIGYGSTLVVAAYPIVPTYKSTSDFYVRVLGHGGTYDDIGTLLNNTIPNTYGSGSEITTTIFVPITGWSSSTQVSDGYDGREISASYTVNSAQSITSAAIFTNFTTKLYDKANIYNTSTGIGTIPSAGRYRISVTMTSVNATAGGWQIAIRKNSSNIYRVGGNYQNVTNQYVCTGSVTIDFNAGDTFDFYNTSPIASGTTYNSVADNIFSIEKLQSPQTMSATERVSGLRNSTSGQSISANTETTIQYANSEEDTHGMWSTSTHDWTVPVAGRYSVNGFLRTTGAETVTAGQIFRVKLYVDGSYSKEMSFIRYLATVAGTEQAAAFSGEVKLNAGQKVSIVLLSTVACTLSSSAGVNWAGIKLLK